MPQRTTIDALNTIALAEQRIAELPPGGDDWQRLRATIIELQQVVSMLSDAAHETPDAVLRGGETVALARQTLSDLGENATNR
jgi:hypothetical protein